MALELEEIASKLAANVAKQFSYIANLGGSEADFRREASRIIEETGNEAGLVITPRDEFTVARGRVDSLYNRLVLEYKRPGILGKDNNHRSNKDVIDQVKNYILDVAKKEKREVSRLAGVATDGFYFIFVRRIGEGWAVDDPVEVNKSSTELFLRLLFSLCQGAALVPEILVQDFGPKHIRTQSAVRAIYRAFISSKNPLVRKLFEQWRLFFSEATDYKEWSEQIESKPEFRTFVKSLWTSEEIEHLDAASVFFVLHTYYALLIKLIATMAAARFAGGKISALRNIAMKEGEDLRNTFIELERGGLFREYGIRNFLEGDFFGWYLSTWDKDIEEAVKTLTKRLAEYDPGTLELAPENARDLLKKLYHYLLPREIRHDLGEYYTPDWLAERLCIQTLTNDLGDPSKRVLDPACGSGTFLVILIKYIKERGTKQKLDMSKTLELILENIIGFDLNPLAVIAARTNYLLALGDLLKARKGDIDIPVYQADSVLTPSQGSSLFDGDVFNLRTSVGEFRIPDIFATRERMDALANTLDECVESKISVDTFLIQIKSAAKLKYEEEKISNEELKNLYLQLQKLHDDGLNGVWARIIKNSFAPLFIEKCNYLIGNPPWVNWESLPDDYRADSIPLWQYYGLFPHSGLETILGKGKKDISMLMTYVSVDRYLNDGGKIGFVLSQSLFKTSGSGQGFRKFLLPNKTVFGPLIVEDLVQVKPFESATNRTAVGIFSKDYSHHYPISYLYWKKRATGRKGTIKFDSPYTEVIEKKVIIKPWKAEPVNKLDITSPWLTARPRALRAIRKIIGTSEYSSHEGVNTGGANAIYWVEVIGKRPGGLIMISNITEGAKRKVSRVQSAIEPNLVFPLLRGRDVEQWNAKPSASIIITQDPEKRSGIEEKVIQKNYPKLYNYLKKFENQLRSRKTKTVRSLMERGAFYSMFGVGDYTFSKWKVVWREQASTFTVAVIGPMGKKTVIPDHKLMLVSTTSKDEAHYICAVLSSSPSKLIIASYTIDIQIGTHVLENIKVPKFNKKLRLHRKLAELSQLAHKVVGKEIKTELEKVEKAIDTYVSKLWNLTDKELSEIRQSLGDM